MCTLWRRPSRPRFRLVPTTAGRPRPRTKSGSKPGACSPGFYPPGSRSSGATSSVSAGPARPSDPGRSRWNRDPEQSIVVVGKDISERGLGFYHPEPLAHRRMVASLQTHTGHWIAFLIDIHWCRFSSTAGTTAAGTSAGCSALCEQANRAGPGRLLYAVCSRSLEPSCWLSRRRKSVAARASTSQRTLAGPRTGPLLLRPRAPADVGRTTGVGLVEPAGEEVLGRGMIVDVAELLLHGFDNRIQFVAQATGRTPRRKFPWRSGAACPECEMRAGPRSRRSPPRQRRRNLQPLAPATAAQPVRTSGCSNRSRLAAQPHPVDQELLR